MAGKNLDKAVDWFSIIAFAVIIIADIVFLFLGYTISENLRDEHGSNNLWILPYYTSVLPGHWFINIYDKITYRKIRYIALASIGVLTLYLNLSILHWWYIPWYITIPGGLTTGAILWPQKKVKSKKKLKSIL